MNSQRFSGEAADRRFERLQSELLDFIARFATRDGENPTAIAPLAVYRMSGLTEETHGLYTPALGIVAQGRKTVTVGNTRYEFERGDFLIVSVDFPVSGRVIEATPEAPYLGLRLDLDSGQVGQLIADGNLPTRRSEDASRGLVASRIGAPLLEAAVRLLRLLESPEDIPVLAPLAVREILYRLLVGEQGGHLRQMALANSRTRRVTQAIARIRRDFAEPLPLEELASEVNMSPSGFHRYFKAVTAMTPLHYQKQLRLQEARRLMLSEDLDAATEAHTAPL